MTATLSIERLRQELVDVLVSLDVGVSPAAFRLRPKEAFTQAARKLSLRLPVREDWLEDYNSLRSLLRAAEAL